jgi:hypothetical protein
MKVSQLKESDGKEKKDDSHLLWDCFVNWSLTLEKNEKND